VHKVTVDPRNESILYVSDVECSDDGPLYLKDPCKASYDGAIFTGVRKLELRPDGTCASVATIAGYNDPANPKTNPTGFADGPVSTAKFHYIHAVALQPQAKPLALGGAVGSIAASEAGGAAGVVPAASTELYICDDNNYRIRKLDVTTGMVSTLAGNGKEGCADGDSATATFGAVGLGIGADGTVYVADYLNHRIRKLVNVPPAPAPAPTPSPAAGNGFSTLGKGPCWSQPMAAQIAKAHKVSAAQVCLRWATQQGDSAVASSSTASYDAQDLASAHFDLTDTEMRSLFALEQTSPPTPSKGQSPLAYSSLAQVSAPPPLPRLNIDQQLISISGLSSGADFAAQFAVAFSKSIMGVGVFAGQPWHCAITKFPNEPTIPLANNCPVFCEGCPAGTTVHCDHCKHTPQFVDVRVLDAAARRLAAAGKIDGIKYLNRTKVYTYCGTKDGYGNGTSSGPQAHMGATKAARDFFAQYGPASNHLFNFTTPSGHAWPEDYGIKKCGDEADHGLWAVENCGYDGPGQLLQHVYGQLNPRAEAMVDKSLTKFDQRPFNATANAALGAAGYIYVPKTCKGGQACSLHVSLHGCSNPMAMEDAQVHALSFNRWAETNNMAVLWPKAMGESCWHSYAREQAYDTKEGAQMIAVRQMIEALSGASM
jgi:poly(3-hydroxybutyrate) depolymerase